jgi:hypothetical protein
MLNTEEKRFIKDIFLDHSITKKDLKTKEKEYKEIGKTFWTTLYNFVVQYRSVDIQENNELLDKWLYEIAPSCCYPKRCDGNILFFKCFLCDLSSFKKTAYLVRHYREKHFDQIPKGIFGPLIIYNCDLCGTNYLRKENLTVHLQSDAHRSKADPNFKNDDIQRKNPNKERKESEIDEWEKKRMKFDDNDRIRNFEKDEMSEISSDCGELYFYSDEEISTPLLDTCNEGTHHILKKELRPNNERFFTGAQTNSDSQVDQNEMLSSFRKELKSFCDSRTSNSGKISFLEFISLLSLDKCNCIIRKLV